MQLTDRIAVVLLAAGLGTRLKPHTDYLPKCLMPIQGIPLLEYWIRMLFELGLENALVNLHYRSSDVKEFLKREIFKGKITTSFEESLLGTAGTLRANFKVLKDKTILMIHADNLCVCDFKEFLNFHFQKRPKETEFTMMTFETGVPESCGIVETDSSGKVIQFHEKVKNPPGNLANAAIYLLEPSVLDFIVKNKLSDFSLEVIPKFFGKIATWKNSEILRDIGNPAQLKEAQKVKLPIQPVQDSWFQSFQKNPIHSLI